jgi:glyoxylase-like metal-dependent hydrolase (beta-lactamase superfamily II)
MFRLFPLFLALISLPSSAEESVYPGYTWLDVGDGIYLHSQTDPLLGPVDGNSVVVIGDVGVMVIDTHINPAVARAVIAKIRLMTDVPVTHVVNTHWHDDHTNGNHEFRRAFPELKIVSHDFTLKSLREKWQPMEEQRRQAYATADISQIRAAAADLEPEDPLAAIGYRVYAGYVEALWPELAAMMLEYPDTVFSESQTVGLGGRDVELRFLGRGNTDGDVIAWLPREKLVITGDILVAPVPFAFDSPMTDWVDTLDAIEALGAATIIPGHGPVQHDVSYLRSVRGLLAETLAGVRDAREAGVGYAELEDAVDLAEQEARFTNGDAEQEFAWRSYYLNPGLKSAWVSLGYPLPDE